MTKNAKEKDTKSVYAKKAQARFEEAKANLDVIKARVKIAALDGQIALEKQTSEARKEAEAHLEVAQRRIERLKDASEESWEDLKEGVESAWDDIAGAVKKIRDRF